jgi:integrase
VVRRRPAAGDWTISRTVTRDADRRTAVGERTKSGGERLVRLGPVAVKALREQQREVARRALSSPVWKDNDLVFRSEVGTAMDPRNLRKDLRPVAARFGWPGPLHSLRHLLASAALAETGNEGLTAKVLGHARRATTTDVYGHLWVDDALGLSSAVGRRLAGG